jgi:tetratricopeptide (TPR) repeat protein
MPRTISTVAVALIAILFTGCGGLAGPADDPFDRGLEHYEREDYDRAIEAFSDAIRIDPSDTEAYHWRGLAYLEKKEYSKAAADQSEAIRRDTSGDITDFYIARGTANYKLKKYQDASLDYEDAARREPGDVAVMNELAWFLVTCPEARFRDGKRALKLAKKFCDQDSTAIHWDTLAAAYAEVGDFAQAVKWQEKVLDDPDEGIEKDLDAAKRRLQLYKEGKAFRDE